MINISILDSIIQLFFVWLGIIGVYNYLFDKSWTKTLIESIALLSILVSVGWILDDATFLLFLILVMCKEKIQTGKLNFRHLNVLLVLITGQILIATLTVYLSRWILYVCLNVDRVENLSNRSHLFNGVQILLMYVVGFIVLGVVQKILKKNSFSITKFQSLNLDRHLFIILMALFGSVELILLVSDFQGVTVTIQLTLLVTFMLMVGLIGWQMIETIGVYIRQKELENEKLQNEQLSNYLKNVEQQYIELRKFKHDYKNLILSLSAQEDMSEMKDYLADATNNEVLNTSLNDVKIAQVQRLKNEAVRGLIIQKFFYAKKWHVELNIEISGNQFQINSNTTPIVRIIGNLLDNAIEQAQKMTDKTVTIAFNNINNTMEISVNNAVDAKFNQNKIFKTGYSTKGNNRGLGLANVRELVDQQADFYLDIEHKGSYVTMTLIIMEDE